MKIKVIKDYPDKELGRIVKAGESLEVSKDRAKTLIDLGCAERDAGGSLNLELEEGK